MKEIQFDKCNGLDSIIDATTGKRPEPYAGMIAALNINDIEIHVTIIQMNENGIPIPINPSKLYGEVVQLGGTNEQCQDIIVGDTVKFADVNICHISTNPKFA